MALKKVVRHPPTYSGDLATTISGATATGAVRGKAINTPHDRFFRAGTYMGAYGYLTIDERGDWTYTKTGSPANGATESINISTRFAYKGQMTVPIVLTFGAGGSGGSGGGTPPAPAVFSTTQYVPVATPWTETPTGFEIINPISGVDDGEMQIDLPPAAGFTIGGVTYLSVFLSSNGSISFGTGQHLIDPDPTGLYYPTLRFGAGDRATGNVYKGYDSATNAYLIRVEGYDYYSGNVPVVWEYRFFSDGTLMVSMSGDGTLVDNHPWEVEPPVSWAWSINNDVLPGMETGLQLAGTAKVGTSAVYQTTDNGASFTGTLGSYVGSAFDGVVVEIPATPWPTSGPGAVLDFQNNVYQLDGVAVARDDLLLLADPDWGTVDTARFVNGQGYASVYPSTGGPRLITDLIARMRQYGFTFVAEFAYAGSGTNEDGAHFDMQMFGNSFSMGMHIDTYGGMVRITSNSNWYETPGTHQFNGDGVGTHKLAGTIMADQMHASVDGQTALIHPFSVLAAITRIGFDYAPYLGSSPSGQYLRKLTFYAPVEAAVNLPALSTL